MTGLFFARYLFLLALLALAIGFVWVGLESRD